MKYDRKTFARKHRSESAMAVKEMVPPGMLTGTFGPDEIESLHECADRLAENGFDIWAAAVSEAACICEFLLKEKIDREPK